MEEKQRDSTEENDLDSSLLMEDILEKLKLLDYEISFSRVKYKKIK